MGTMRREPDAVLITGGGSGIGLALARALTARGDRVVVCGRSVEKLEHAGQIDGVRTVRCDLSTSEGVDALVRTVRTRYPEVNVLVNNAGIMRRVALTGGATDLDIQAELATNLYAPIRLTLGLLPQLLSHGRGCIVNVTSALAWVPMAGAPVYCATKAGLHSFTQSLRTQLDGTAAHVMEVLPPTVDTAMTVGVETKKIDVDVMARAMVRGVDRRSDEVVIGQARILRALATVAPALARRILAKAA